MRSPIEIIDRRLILPLSELRTEFGLAFLYFGLLLGIKASEILDNPWLLGLWAILFLVTLYLDLSRPSIHSQINAVRRKDPSKGKTLKISALKLLGVAVGIGGSTLLLLNFSEAFFFRIESRLRVIHYGDNLVNWILLSVIIVAAHLLGALVSLHKTDTAPYARLFPIIALGIIYFKGVLS